jgi:hypothetical protein
VIVETGDRSYQPMRYAFGEVEAYEGDRIMDYEHGWWIVVTSPHGFTYTRDIEEAARKFVDAIRIEREIGSKERAHETANRGS